MTVDAYTFPAIGPLANNETSEDILQEILLFYLNVRPSITIWI